MDAPGSGDGLRDEPDGLDPLEPVESRETGDTLDRLVGLLGLRLDEVRSLAEEATSRWRGDRVRVGEGTKRRVRDLAREVGLVTRDEWDDLELRVAQLEHRLRLLEESSDRASCAGS
jgi:polyhydroxyalkanoate synthesis regulator phasin